MGLFELLKDSIKRNTKQYSMLIAVVVIWATFTFLTGHVFLTPRNLSNLFVQTVTTAILAIGMVLVIVAGHIDLSVGSVLGFTGAICAIAMVRRGFGVFPAVVVTLIAGAAVGAWHGFWVAYRRVPSFIVTLASMLAFRGLIIGISGGQTIGLEMAPERVAEQFKPIGQGYLPTIRAAAEGQLHDTSLYFVIVLIAVYVLLAFRRRAARQRYGFPVLPLYAETLRLGFVSAAMAALGLVMVFYLGIPWSILIVLALTLLLSFVAGNTTFGRHLYAIGGNAEAARLSGISVQRHTFGLFVLMGVMTALAGIVYTARLNAATTSAGQNAELDAIAAAVIGGASLAGGEGTIFGAIVGALVMTSLDNGMSLMNLDITYQYVIKGLILLLAVWADMAQRKKT
jgi:D-xylose transport system permease protein